MKGIAKAIALIILGLAVLTPFASTYPDGLERVAESLGIEEPEPVWGGLMPDYTIQIIENPYVTKIVSGLIGLFFVLSVAWVIGWVSSRKNHD